MFRSIHIYLLVIFIFLTGCRTNIAHEKADDTHLVMACQKLGGELKKYSDDMGIYYLCHFPDGSFCASGLMIKNQCIPGKWQYKPSHSDALTNPE